MRRFLLLLASLVFLLILSTDQAIAQTCMSGVVQEGYIEILPDPINYGDVISIKIYFHLGEASGDRLYAIFNPSATTHYSAVLNNQGVQKDELGEEYLIYTGTFDTNLIPYGEEHNMAIYPDDKSFLEPCSNFFNLKFLGAPDKPKCPPEGELCQCEGDRCYGTTLQPPEGSITRICDPVNYYCNDTNNTIELRKCSDGSACCYDEIGMPFCTTGVPEVRVGDFNCLCVQPRKIDNHMFCIAEDGSRGINTAIGCFPISNNDEFLKFFITWAVSVAGGLGLLLIVYAAFLLITSSGNPIRINSGKDTLYSAIFGLILIVISVYVLKIMGIDILGLKNIGL